MSNTPKVRFKGFGEEWERRRLGEHIKEYHETTTVNNQYPVLTSSRKGIFLQTKYLLPRRYRFYTHWSPAVHRVNCLND